MLYGLGFGARGLEDEQNKLEWMMEHLCGESSHFGWTNQVISHQSCLISEYKWNLTLRISVVDWMSGKLWLKIWKIFS